MKSKAQYRLLFIMVSVIFSLGWYPQKPKDKDSDSISIKPELISHKSETDPDKTLLIGEWSRTGTPLLIKITGVLETGKLEVEFYNPNKIEIEMANWSKISMLLSVYIELKDAEFPGSNFKLNYIPERDVLVGVYTDALRNVVYPVEFIRIK